MRRGTPLFPILALLLSLGLFSCSEAPSYPMTMEARDSSPGFSQSRAVESAVAAPSPEDPVTGHQRLLIRRAGISLEVRDLEQAEVELSNQAQSFGGYVQGSELRETSLTMTFRVPAEHLESFLASFEGQGEIQSKSLSSEDVSDQYQDLETRLRSQRILVERLQNYLSTARSIEDLLSIEFRLNEAQTRLEQMEGQFRGLQGRIDLATVQARISLRDKSLSVSVWQSLGKDVTYLFSSWGSFLASLLVFIIALLVYGVPILGLIILFYWLGFGNIGLLRRLYRTVSPPNSKAPKREASKPPASPTGTD